MHILDGENKEISKNRCNIKKKKGATKYHQIEECSIQGAFIKPD
jgi:hypothetical protein